MVTRRAKSTRSTAAGGRELPNQLSLVDRLALHFWDSLTEAEQVASPMGPPEWPLRRWARLMGHGDDWRRGIRP